MDARQKAIADAGHMAIREALALERQIADLHRTPVTVADLILGTVAGGINLMHARTKLKEARAVLETHGESDFEYEAMPNSFREHVERFAQIVDNAEKYASDRKKR
jgi:hypothetical protein